MVLIRKYAYTDVNINTTIPLRANYTYNFEVYGAGGGSGASSTVNGVTYAGGKGAKGTYVNVLFTLTRDISVVAYVPAGGLKGTDVGSGGYGGNATTIISTDEMKSIVIIAAGGGGGSNAFGSSPGADGEPGSTVQAVAATDADADGAAAATDAADAAAANAQRITSAVNAGELYGGGAQRGAVLTIPNLRGTGGTSYSNLVNTTYSVTYGTNINAIAIAANYTSGGSDSNGSDGIILITETPPVDVLAVVDALAATAKGLQAKYSKLKGQAPRT
jgi:hypothetical protein